MEWLKRTEGREEEGLLTVEEGMKREKRRLKESGKGVDGDLVKEKGEARNECGQIWRV